MPEAATVQPPAGALVTVRDLHKSFSRKRQKPEHALSGVSMELYPGTLTALVGPDGAGKTTLLRTITALLGPDSGTLDVLGCDPAKEPERIQSRVGYMPQKFGLYEDLSIQENLDLYADLHGISREMRSGRFEKLLAMTNLKPFTERQAGRLSGGMKQKLGLACTLVRLPDLLVLDEPTVGVDPVSRKELWETIQSLVKNERLTVLISTTYMDEAERCDNVLVMREGKVVAQGKPADIAAHASGRTFRTPPPEGRSARSFQAELMNRADITDAVPEGGCVRFVTSGETGAECLPDGIHATPAEPRLEDGFMAILHRNVGKADTEGSNIRLTSTLERGSGDAVIQVRDLQRSFGSFMAVNHVDFKVRRGEVFGLLGPNGAGKTTTFRMLCGLLPASGGHIDVAGMDVRRTPANARQKLGYMAQKFSLYGQLSVMENLQFFARAYGLHGTRKAQRIQWAVDSFQLAPFAGQNAQDLPGGYKQRLAMAAALLHEPEVLFLDEPTSGADPLARREFWQRIAALSSQGVTIIVTTHFMEEAEYCDDMVIMDAGQVLARGTPAEVRGKAPTMEDAFVKIVLDSRARKGGRE